MIDRFELPNTYVSGKLQSTLKKEKLLNWLYTSRNRYILQLICSLESLLEVLLALNIVVFNSDYFSLMKPTAIAKRTFGDGRCKITKLSIHSYFSYAVTHLGHPRFDRCLQRSIALRSMTYQFLGYGRITHNYVSRLK